METKTVYVIEIDKKYAGVLTLDSTDKSPSGKWNIPANCTELKPLEEKEGFNVAWNGTGWEYIEIPKEPEEPKPTIEQLKTDKIAKMKAERDNREVQDIEYNGKMFDYDDKSRERLSLARQSLEDNGTDSILWTCADNTRTNLTLEDFKAINTLSATRSTQLHEQYNKLKLLINSLETEEQIKEVTFDTDTSIITLNTGD